MNVELKSKEAIMQNDNLSEMLAEVQVEESKANEENDEYGEELTGMGGDMNLQDSAAGREYADSEYTTGVRNDIFAEDNAENILERMNKMAAEEENPSNATASAITQQWEKDSRKDPEEEYFRLSCLALKIIYNEQDTDFVFTVSVFIGFLTLCKQVAPGKLYQKCKKQKIPFHLWYNWIEKEL